MTLTAQQSIEIKVRRRNLVAYIAADPVQVILTRYPRIDDGAGGWIKGAAVIVPAQTMRLIPYKRRLSKLTDMVTPGEIPNVQYSLIARYDADVERYDEFELNGEALKVIGVEPKSKIPDMSDRLTILVEIRDGAY
jgi:hypothetical protein